MWSLLLCVLSSAPVFAGGAVPPAAVTVDAVTLEPGARPSMLLAEARRRARRGDHVGMRIVAEQALEQPGDHQRQAQLLIGVSYELEGQPATALAMYDLLLSAYPANEQPEVLHLRRATVLGQLGEYRSARRQLRKLERRQGRAGLDPDRKLQSLILQGTWDLEEGRDRRGLKTLRDALAMPTASPWWRAKGHSVLIGYALEQCDHFPLTGDPDEIESALDLRGQLLDLAYDQAVRLARLDQPRLTMEALTRLARSHAVVGDDVLELASYLDEAERLRRVEHVWLKAVGFFDRGLLVAQRDLGDAEAVRALEAERTAIQERIERL